MEFRDLRAQYESLKPEVDAAVSRVLEHGRYIGGPEIAELDRRLAEYARARHCITCGNGTDAIQLALMAWASIADSTRSVPRYSLSSSTKRRSQTQASSRLRSQRTFAAHGPSASSRCRKGSTATRS